MTRAQEIPQVTGDDDNGNGRDGRVVVCPGGKATEDCPGTHPPPAPVITPTSWRQSAVSWGMLGLLLVALWGGWQALRTVRGDLAIARSRAIGTHDTTAAAHPDLRNAVERNRRENNAAHRELGTQLKAQDRKLDRVLRALVRPRRRRRR